MDVIGIDLSLNSTGMACSHGPVLVKPNKDERGLDRVETVTGQLLEHMDLHIDPVVVLEGYAMGGKGRVFDIAEMGGVLKWRLRLANIPLSIVPPTSRAKFITGKGNANKAMVVSFATLKREMVFNSDDEADAWVLYQMGMTQLGQSSLNIPKINLTAMEKVDWSW